MRKLNKKTLMENAEKVLENVKKSTMDYYDEDEFLMCEEMTRKVSNFINENK
jgi:hypothetical protein